MLPTHDLSLSKYLSCSQKSVLQNGRTDRQKMFDKLSNIKDKIVFLIYRSIYFFMFEDSVCITRLQLFTGIHENWIGHKELRQDRLSKIVYTSYPISKAIFHFWVIVLSTVCLGIL